MSSDYDSVSSGVLSTKALRNKLSILVLRLCSIVAIAAVLYAEAVASCFRLPPKELQVESATLSRGFFYYLHPFT